MNQPDICEHHRQLIEYLDNLPPLAEGYERKWVFNRHQKMDFIDVPIKDTDERGQRDE